ncbi:lysophospholipid acyltransferase family protein [Corynebacterium vitaeruminis]|uniref:lysophospholipid acyltransferase family protein n=1 Tax=Corynebacterium vitaeruminis TaxID=38305 RepID=UPI000B2CD154
MHDRDIWEKRSIFWVAKNTPSYEPHPSEAKEPFYGRIVVPLIKRMLAAQGIDFTLEGVENLPATGPALLAFNHTGYFDFIFGGTVASLKGHRLVRFMAKKEIFDVPVVGLIMRGMRHISVDRAAGAASLDEAVRSLREGNLVGIFPEATISRAFEIKGLKSGAVRIAAQSGAPLIPVAIWGSQRVWTKDHPRQLGRNHFPVWIKVGSPVDISGTPEEATARLKKAMEALVDEVRTRYEEAYGPFPGGEYWRPVSMGGSAPSLEQAARIDAEEKRQRAERKAAKAAKSAKGPRGLRAVIGRQGVLAKAAKAAKKLAPSKKP